MSNSQRERAEAAFGHMQKAATEMIRAAQETLDMLEDAVAAAGLAGILHRLNQVGGSVFARASGPPPAQPVPVATAAGPTDDGPPGDPVGRPTPAVPGPPRHRSPVERIPIR